MLRSRPPARFVIVTPIVNCLCLFCSAAAVCLTCLRCSSTCCSSRNITPAVRVRRRNCRAPELHRRRHRPVPDQRGVPGGPVRHLGRVRPRVPERPGARRAQADRRAQGQPLGGRAALRAGDRSAGAGAAALRGHPRCLLAALCRQPTGCGPSADEGLEPKELEPGPGHQSP